MEEEEEICRVCRSEGTLEQPLFHPCKCAGSIRHVHQDCLIEWLSHSKKKYCELCEHPFTFTPVYRQDMPEVIPAKLIFQQFRKKVAYMLLTVSRAILVSTIWLVILPYFTVWIWRMYFFLGNYVSKRLARLQEMKNQIGSATSTANITTILTNHAATANEDNATNLNWLQEYKSRFTLQTFLADCFEGQIITCIVVIIFVAVFLLREWIVQNIPMDGPPIVEEEEEEQHHQPQIVQVEQPVLLERPVRPMRDNNQRFDSLFDIHWDENHHDNGPPSPIAEEIHNPMEASSSSDSVFQPNNEFNNKPARAASMPPSLSRTSSFNYDSQSQQAHEEAAEENHFRRSASMEPSIDTSLMERNTAPVPPMLIHRGLPPNAPRMRHAEAPIAIRPIPEEDEEPQPQQQQQQQLPVREIPPPPAAAAPAAVVDDADDEENIEEFEGVLEAIGMNGSIWSLLQNSALMGLLIALSIGAAVWLPYLLGMVFIMTETLDLIRIPLKLTRLVTDPLIDYLFMACSDYIWPWITNIYTETIQPILQSSTIFDKISIAFMYIFNYIKDHGLLFADSSHTTLSDTVQAATNGTQTESFIDSSIQYVSKLINETEPFLEHAFNRYQGLATGQTAMDRFACIAVGYILVMIVSCWYLARAAHNSIATAAFGRTAQEAIRHQGIILKVAMFITIELVLFPIVCGFLLDASTLPLFKHASLPGRFGYLISHPVPSIFLHWFLGTGFMFLFAVLVTICRDIVRPGVMWFIRDPNDPQFHPIREIVERPVFFQFKKIGASALIYMTVILVGVGGVVHCIHAVSSNILPLRWSLSDYTGTSNPLSIVPIDLIIIQVGIPAIVKYFKPKQTIKRLFIEWTKATCRQLRLTSFIFGGRKPEEEGTLVYHSWWAWLTRTKPEHYPPAGTNQDVIGNEVSYFWDGQLLRVPRHDSVPIIERRRMLVPIDNYTLEPVDEVERMLGHPAATAAGGEEVNTVVVYSPPNFKQRLIIFVGFMWLSSSIFFCAMTVLPVVFGRHIFKECFHVQNEVHDIYSFVLGGAILLLCGATVSRFFKAVNDIWFQSDWSGLFSTLWSHIKSFSSWAIRWIWFIWSFGVVLPLTFGILIELYFVLPLRQLGEDSPSVEVITVWSHGFACMVIFHGFIQVVPDATARNIINNVFRGGIGNMNIKESVSKLIGPLLLVSGVAICLPFIVAFVNMKVVARTNPELRVKLVQIAYPTALIGIGTYYLSKFGSRIRRRLTETIREDNYLVGRTLHNLDH